MNRKQIQSAVLLTFQCSLSTNHYTIIQYISSSDHSIALPADMGKAILGSCVMSIVTLPVSAFFC